MAERFARGCERGTLLTLRISPGAKKSAVSGTYGENTETEKFLAETLGLSSSGVSMVRGGSGRDKVVLVEASRPREVAKILDAEGG